MPDLEQQAGNHRTRRRTLLWGGLAGMAGLGVSVGMSVAPPWTVAAPVPGFWDLRWPGPQGQEVSLAAFRGSPLIVNFWATWCPPCVEELPMLDEFYRQQRGNGTHVVGLAIDRKDAVVGFLAKLPLSFPIAIAGTSGMELGRALGNLKGGLPFSVVIGSDGTVAQRKLGRLVLADLEQWRSVK